MLNKVKNRKQEGFTIIEVLIVLAIAGLILLIVFLAVPALQRNSRNTQRRNDVAQILGAVTEYTNNNNGSLPASSANPGTAASNFNSQFVNANPNPGYYTTPANIVWTNSAAAVAPAPTAGLDNVYVYNFAKCNGNAVQAVASGGQTSRSVIALYWIEGSGGTTVPQCRET